MNTADQRALTKRTELVKELLAIEKKWAPDEPRHKEIRAALLTEAREVGKSVIIVPGLGKASISPPRDEQFDGEFYEIDAKVFLALSDKERDAVMKKAGIRKVAKWKDAYSGRVTPELF